MSTILDQAEAAAVEGNSIQQPITEEQHSPPPVSVEDKSFSFAEEQQLVKEAPALIWLDGEQLKKVFALAASEISGERVDPDNVTCAQRVWGQPESIFAKIEKTNHVVSYDRMGIEHVVAEWIAKHVSAKGNVFAGCFENKYRLGESPGVAILGEVEKISPVITAQLKKRYSYSGKLRARLGL
jgi:hypothetical protein